MNIGHDQEESPLELRLGPEIALTVCPRHQHLNLGQGEADLADSRTILAQDLLSVVWILLL